MEQKRCISSLTLAELTAALKAMGQPGFRAKQIFHWVHQKLVTEFSAMTDQPKTLLAKLEEQFYIAAPKIERFFWGIAAVTWIRYGYPLVAKGMKAVKRRIRPWMTALLAVFMAVNLVTSALALARYDARTSGAAPANAVDVLLDEHFDNARMERIYPNAKKVEKAG